MDKYELLAETRGQLKGRAILTINEHPAMRALFDRFSRVLPPFLGNCTSGIHMAAQLLTNPPLLMHGFAGVPHDSSVPPAAMLGLLLAREQVVQKKNHIKCAGVAGRQVRIRWLGLP